MNVTAAVWQSGGSGERCVLPLIFSLDRVADCLVLGDEALLLRWHFSFLFIVELFFVVTSSIADVR